MGACDNMISAWKLFANLQEKERFIDVVHDGIKEGSRRKMVASLRQFIEVDHHKGLVSVKLLDQHIVVQEVLGPALDKKTSPDAKIRSGPEELTWKVGERKGQTASVDTTRIRPKRVGPSSGRQCQTLCGRLSRRIG